jgi:hypothetical protein
MYRDLPAIYNQLLKSELDLIFDFKKQKIKQTLVEQKVSNRGFS